MQLLIYLSFLIISYKIFRFIKLKNGDFKSNYKVQNDIFTINSKENETTNERNLVRKSSLARDLNEPATSIPIETIKDQNNTYASTSSNLHLIN